MMLRERLQGEEGVTLIELLAALVISVMIGGILLAVLWPAATRSTQIVGYTAAQRKVLLVNHALTNELHRAKFVQIESTPPTTSPSKITLWLYGSGAAENQSSDTERWLYNTTTRVDTPPTNSTNEAIVESKCFGAFVFSQQSDGTWNVTYVDQIQNVPTNSTGCLNLDATTLGDVLLNESGLQVDMSFPDVNDATALSGFNCKFVNSFVIRLSTTYKTSNGQSQTYYLTAGYHDGLLR